MHPLFMGAVQGMERTVIKPFCAFIIRDWLNACCTLYVGVQPCDSSLKLVNGMRIPTSLPSVHKVISNA